jgi:hypothetical protein
VNVLICASYYTFSSFIFVDRTQSDSLRSGSLICGLKVTNDFFVGFVFVVLCSLLELLLKVLLLLLISGNSLTENGIHPFSFFLYLLSSSGDIIIA